METPRTYRWSEEGGMMTEYLPEQLKTSRNLIDIALLLIETEHMDLLPTVLELLKIEVDNIVLENCVVDKELDTEEG